MFSENGQFLGGVSAREQLIIWNTKTFQQVFVKLFQNPINILNFKNTYMTLLNSKNIQ